MVVRTTHKTTDRLHALERSFSDRSSLPRFAVCVYEVRHVLSNHLSHCLALNMKLFTIGIAVLATAGLSAAAPTPVNGDQKYVRSVSGS